MENKVIAVAQSTGRRVGDVVAFILAEGHRIMEIWEDERGRYSTRRILLWWWTALGTWSIIMEVTAKAYVLGGHIVQPHFLNNAWIVAWSSVEGGFTVAVFGPIMVDYWKNATPALESIGRAVRGDKLETVPALLRRVKAAEVGSPGTEYNE